jgi:hypothetical protein
MQSYNGLLQILFKGYSMKRVQSFYASLNRNKGKIVGAAALGLTAAANAAVTMPTADYTNIETAAGIGFGVVLTVGLLMKAKRFFR